MQIAGSSDAGYEVKVDTFMNDSNYYNKILWENLCMPH